MAKYSKKKKPKKTAASVVMPTFEAQKKGQYIQQRVDRGGPKVARNTSIVPLEDCFTRGQISWGMYNAGLQYERLSNAFRALIEAPTAGRDSCDFSVRGGLSETPIERSIRIKEAYIDARLSLEREQADVLLDILIEHQPTGDRRDKYKRWSTFVSGLKTLQTHWKIAEAEVA